MANFQRRIDGLLMVDQPCDFGRQVWNRCVPVPGQWDQPASSGHPSIVPLWVAASQREKQSQSATLPSETKSVLRGSAKTDSARTLTGPGLGRGLQQL